MFSRQRRDYCARSKGNSGRDFEYFVRSNYTPREGENVEIMSFRQKFGEDVCERQFEFEKLARGEGVRSRVVFARFRRGELRGRPVVVFDGMQAARSRGVGGVVSPRAGGQREPKAKQCVDLLLLCCESFTRFLFVANRIRFLITICSFALAAIYSTLQQLLIAIIKNETMKNGAAPQKFKDQNDS